MRKISTLLTMMMFVAACIAQSTGSIKGKITTADNKAAEGVTIIVKNTARNAVADNNGAFEIKNVQPGSYTLLVTLIGHQDAEQEVTVENGKAASVGLQLTLSNKELNEVVVTANKKQL